MPRASVWFVRASLVYLVVGFTIGALLLADRGLGDTPALWRWRPAHVEFLLVGWVVQLVMGEALWIFPRFGVRRSRWADPAAWLALALLNAGVLLAAAGPVLASPRGAAALALGRGLRDRRRAHLRGRALVAGARLRSLCDLARVELRAERA